MEYTKENYELIKTALSECYKYLETLESVPDVGSCNYDTICIDFTGWPIAKVRSLPYTGHKPTSKWWKGSVFLDFNYRGVANNRNYIAETANKFLKLKGVASVIYYQLD